MYCLQQWYGLADALYDSQASRPMCRCASRLQFWFVPLAGASQNGH